MARSPQSRPRQIGDMIRIAITIEAFAALARTLPLGSVATRPNPTEGLIWLDRATVDRLRFLRRPGRA
jgi:hypothetical protein